MRSKFLYVFLGHLNTFYMILFMNIFYIILSFYAILPFFYGHVLFCWYIGAYYILWILMNSLKVNIDANIFTIFLHSLWKFFLSFWSIFFCGTYFLPCFSFKSNFTLKYFIFNKIWILKCESLYNKFQICETATTKR